MTVAYRIDALPINVSDMQLRLDLLNLTLFKYTYAALDHYSRRKGADNTGIVISRPNHNSRELT